MINIFILVKQKDTRVLLYINADIPLFPFSQSIRHSSLTSVYKRIEEQKNKGFSYSPLYFYMNKPEGK